jgi:Tol biopolymer transport system component/DNA-binding winged helix-turn-helix (wHTH) protein
MSDVHEFGPFRLELSEHRLLRRGEPIPLTSKSFLVLATLVTRAGHLVTRAELIELVWPDVVVEENNLSYCVSMVRKALDDDAAPHRYIETVPKQGYRFIGEIHRPEPRKPRLRRAFVAATAVVASLVAGYGVLGLGRGRSPAVIPPAMYGTAVVPLTTYPGWEGSPSLSPDGTQVAFIWDGADRTDFDIYVKLVGDGEPLRVSHDPRHEVAPAWSPDGRRLAFLRIPLGPGPWDLVVKPALGGAERLVASLQPFGPPIDHRGGTWMSWTPDSRYLAIGGVIDEQAGVWLVEVDDPGRRRLTDSRPGRVDRSPMVSTDGRRVAFISAGPEARGTLFVMALGDELEAVGSAQEIVDPSPRYVGSVAWGADHTSLVYAVASHMGMSSLEMVRLDSDRLRAAGRPELLPIGEQATGLGVAPSGRLVYVRQQRDSGFWTMNLESPEAGLTEFSTVASSLDERTPHYSPDGRRLVFASTRSGTEEIWIADVDGSNTRQMTSMGGAPCWSPQWSPDGRQVAFASTSDGSTNLYLLDPETARIRRLTSTPGLDGRVFGRGAPSFGPCVSWSHDGLWIYFGMQADELSEMEIWKISSQGGDAVQMTTSGGLCALESDDGRALYVTRPHPPASSLWRIPLDGGPEVRLADDVAGVMNVALGRRAVYYLAVGQLFSSTSVGAIDIATGKRTTLASFGRPPWWGLTVSPDERHLLVSAVNGNNLDLMVVDPR